MKIGIITLPLWTNYGGILQAYALQTILERMGHEVVEIEQKVEYKRACLPFYKAPIVILKRIILRYILHKKNIRVFAESYFNEQILPNIEKTIQHTQRFVNEHIHRTYVKTFCEVEELGLDGIIVGSDQIWRPLYIKQNLPNAFLSFAKEWNVKRISYAASFGAETWEYTPEQTSECADLLKLFDAVSVREENGVAFCNNYLGCIDAVQVLDPTLLLQKEDYLSLLKETDCKKRGNMMVYILDKDPEITYYIETFATAHGYKPFYTNSSIENCDAPLEDRIQPPLEEWLQGFREADIIMTDSFHACVFSIIFTKPFLVIKNEKRGLARIMSLLRPLGLTDRIINKSSFREDVKVSTIDYAKVYAILNEKKYASLNFLYKALS